MSSTPRKNTGADARTGGGGGVSALLLFGSATLGAAVALSFSGADLWEYFPVGSTAYKGWVPSADAIPAQAQIIDPRSFGVMPTVPPPSVQNVNTKFTPPGTTPSSLKAKPFHVYNEAFWEILGPNPTLTLIAAGHTNLSFHEAPIWYPPTDEMFFCQSAGPKEAGTGLKKSAMLGKVSLKAAGELAARGNGTGLLNIDLVHSDPLVINPNGGANFRGQLAFTGEGQGDEIAPALYLMNPLPPYNTTVLVNSYYGRQFNSLNDLAVHPKNKDIYFTDVVYGQLQDFRPAPALPNQVYRLSAATGAVKLVADGFDKCNGIAFSPDGKWAYVTDTGSGAAFYPPTLHGPATIYRFPVDKHGNFGARQAFAYVYVARPDGVHCDSKGNVYSSVGDGVHVWDPQGTLLGVIYTGQWSANFQFAGKGRMVILAESELYYVTLAAEGMRITDL